MTDLRVVELTYDQIADNWKLISHAVSHSLPPTSDEYSPNFLLENFLTGKLQCWVVFKVEENLKSILAIFTTSINIDFSGSKYCLIYSAYGLAGIDVEVYDKCFEVVSIFAKSKDCKEVIAYSNNKTIINRAEMFSGLTDYRVLKFKL